MKQDTLRIDGIRVENFRCFAECDLRLHPRLTVLVAENGQGKTGLLDALAMALGPVVQTLSDGKQWDGLSVSDVRRQRVGTGMTVSLPTSIAATGWIDGQAASWAVMRASTAPRTKTKTTALAQLRAHASRMRARLDSFAQHGREVPPALPLVAHYGTGRLWAAERLTEARRARDDSALGRVAGYQDALSSSSSFRAFAAWYGDMAFAVRTPTSRVDVRRENPVRLLAAVRKATRIVLEPTGWTDLDWEFTSDVDGELVVEHALHGRLPLSRLSDGVRNMIALVGDMAHRCGRLNPEFGENAAEATPGLVLIDEIDMHLHPRWQQVVVALLCKAFPQIQFVLTTHSPQVLSTVDHSSIRVMSVDTGIGRISEPKFQTRGVESADILARVMGVHSIPQIPESAWLSSYKALLQQGEDLSPEGRRLWAQIVDHFGEQHPALEEVEVLRRMFELKRRHAAMGARG